jgi:ATP-binding cassette, subfamily B (MDR/TAP), member 1
MSDDTVLIQDSMGGKVGNIVQLLIVFFSGFAVAFTQGWILTLIMLATIPPLVPGRPPQQ